MIYFLLIFSHNVSAEGTVNPFVKSIEVYTLHADSMKPKSSLDLWAPFELDPNFNFKQLLLNIKIECPSSPCKDAKLEIKQPYKVRKAFMSSEEYEQLYALENEKVEFIGQYIAFNHSEEEYLAMIYKMSPEERQRLEILTANIDKLKKKDEQLLQQGMNTEYHMEKSIKVDGSDLGSSHYENYWIVIDYLSCGENQYIAKFDSSPKWTTKTIDLECVDYSH